MKLTLSDGTEILLTDRELCRIVQTAQKSQLSIEDAARAVTRAYTALQRKHSHEGVHHERYFQP